MKAILACVAALAALTACGKNDAGQPAPVVQAAPAMPAHYYAMKDGLEYGYEEAISEEARKHGQAAVKLMMFSYLGEKAGAYQVMNKDGNVRSVAECSRPCDYAKVYTFMGDRFVDKQILKLTEGALLRFVLADAMRGKLEPLSGDQKGRLVSFWVDGEAKRLVVSAVDPK